MGRLSFVRDHRLVSSENPVHLEAPAVHPPAHTTGASGPLERHNGWSNPEGATGYECAFGESPPAANVPHFSTTERAFQSFVGLVFRLGMFLSRRENDC
jgi:hypothetical protein